jgi:peptide deformylase
MFAVDCQLVMDLLLQARALPPGKRLADLLLLGDPRLYQRCDPLEPGDPGVPQMIADLHQVMEDVRARYGFGRAIAAPQLGYMQRLIYMNVDRPQVFINPAIVARSAETFELWDDCMSFPNLLVRVRRHRRIGVQYLDEHWKPQEIAFEDDLSELFQHEFDHLEGVLCTQRAVDDRAFKWRS